MDAAQYPVLSVLRRRNLGELHERFQKQYCSMYGNPKSFIPLLHGCGRCIEACIVKLTRNKLFMDWQNSTYANRKQYLRPISGQIHDVTLVAHNKQSFFIPRRISPLTVSSLNFPLIGMARDPSHPPLTPGNEKIEVTIMKQGIVTEYMHNMKPGSYMGIWGAAILEGATCEKFSTRRFLLMGCGCGFAPYPFTYCKSCEQSRLALESDSCYGSLEEIRGLHLQTLY
jgi:ferredoxin